MSILWDNIRWNVNRQYFCHLVAPSVSIESMQQKLYSLCRDIGIYSTNKQVDTNSTRFALNDIALSITDSSSDKYLYSHYNNCWNTFVAAKGRLNQPLPYVNNATRIEQLAELFVQCTQLCYTYNMWREYINSASQLLSLTDREKHRLDDALMLARCKYYCAVFRLSRKDSNIVAKLANFAGDKTDLICHSYVDSDYYSNNCYIGDFACVVDCFGSSKVKIGQDTVDNDVRATVVAKGRTIFDTFTRHKYGKHSCNFCATTNSVQCNMQYFIKDNCEIRRYQVVAKSRQKYNITFYTTTQSSKCQLFQLDGVQCVATDKYYIAYCCVIDNNIALTQYSVATNNSCVNLDMSLSILLAQQQCLSVDFVTVYAKSMQQLIEDIARIATIGYTRCDSYQDSYTQGQLYSIKTHIKPASNMYLPSNTTCASNLISYTYQFGEGSVSTLVDSSGNSATLVSGFCFGMGEKIYGIKGCRATQLNIGKFDVNVEGYNYHGTIGCDEYNVTSKHASNSKSWHIDSKGSVLVVLPLEENSRITKSGNTFDIYSDSRRFAIVASDNLTCFTTNGIECNNKRLRTKLSNDLDSGNCLAMYFASGQVNIDIINSRTLPAHNTMISESLLSTYLNYINSKNMFLVANHLVAMSPLMMASLVYTNRQFVREYLTATKYNNYYYNRMGQKISYADPLVYPLALLYYVALTGERELLDDKTVQYLTTNIIDKQYHGQQQCIKLLILLKMTQLCVNKVQSLIAYTNLRRIVVSDRQLYAYAQAIGAVDMVNASKQRLKDLCNKCKIDRCWYYVSQIENIYGINLVCNKLTIKPKVSSSQALEQLALNIASKRIDTTFSQDSVYSLVLNGNACYQGVDIDKLQTPNNQLSVKF